MRKLLGGAAAAVVLCAASSAGAVNIYTETFEDGVADGFAGYTNVTTAPAGQLFLGQMDLDETGVLALNLTGYNNVQLAFDLYAIQSLDGGPDNFVVLQGANVLFDYSFGNVFNQSYPNGGVNPPQTGSVSQDELGYPNYFGSSSTYRITLSLTGGGPTTISFVGGSDQGQNDESFGVDNILVTGNVIGAGVPEPATWAMMILGFGGVGALMRRRRQGAAYA